MRQLWRLLTRGCWRCRWETVEVVDLEVRDPTGGPTVTGQRHYLRCQTCGWVIKRDLA